MSVYNQSIRTMKNVGSSVTANPSNFTLLQNSQTSYNTNSINASNINLEKTSVELSLNVIGLGHQAFENMSKHDFLSYYESMSKQQGSINKILALKVLLKYKMEQNNQPIHQDNSAQVANIQSNQNSLSNPILGSNQTYTTTNYDPTEEYNKLYNPNRGLNSSLSFKPTNENSFGLKQDLPENRIKNMNYNNPFNHQPIQQNYQQPVQPIQQNPQSIPQRRNIDISYTQNNGQFNSGMQPTQRSSDIPREFDISSIIDNYSRAKNNGMGGGGGKNIDVSYGTNTGGGLINIQNQNNIVQNQQSFSQNQQPFSQIPMRNSSNTNFGGMKKNIDISFTN